MKFKLIFLACARFLVYSLPESQCEINLPSKAVVKQEGRKKILVAPKMVSFFSAELTAAKKLPFLMQPENISALRIFVGFTNCGLVSVGAMGAVYVYLKV